MSFDLNSELDRRRQYNSSSESAEQPRVFSVFQLNTAVREILQSTLSRVWVAGEVSDYSRPRSGHIYFTLKDSDAQVKAIIWRSTASRLPFDVEDGMQLLCEVDIDLYVPRGSYQLIVQKAEPQGVGGWQLALRKLYTRLQAEGLFDASIKKPLPRFPRKIAVVTSPTGAAVQDFLQVVRRRWRTVEIVIVPTRVQGEEAVPEIARAIQAADQLSPDVVVVTRGGGSLEDLWCFNNEQVVRTIVATEAPVISAVGHEIDVTLADHAADVRALTPSEAGERVVPLRSEVTAGLHTTTARLQRTMQTQLTQLRSQLLALSKRGVLRRPTDRLRDAARRLDELQLRALRATERKQAQQRERLAAMASRLEALSPLQVLARGYSLTLRERDGKLIQSATDVEIGGRIVTQVSWGHIISSIEQIQNHEE